MSGLADQQSETDDSQIAAFAFGVSAPGQLARRYGGDVRIEVGRTEGEDSGRKLEPGHRSLRDRHLRLLEGVLGDLLRYPPDHSPNLPRPLSTWQGCPASGIARIACQKDQYRTMSYIR